MCWFGVVVVFLLLWLDTLRASRYFILETWDDDLGYLLGPAVFAYEQERVCGASFGGDDFQDAVQGAVPER